MKKPLVILACLIVSVQLPAAEPPAKVLDLASWKLTLPVDTDLPGQPDEIEQPHLATFQDPLHFYVGETGNEIVFRAPCGGVPTKGSRYPRCELREMTAAGDKDAAWGTADGWVHTLTATLAIAKTPAKKKHVVCAQIHDASDDVLMIRLEGKKLFVERESLEDAVLDANYQLGTPFEIKIEAADGSIDVWHNAARKLSWQVAKQGCYFKVGCYTQSNPSQGDLASDYAEVVVSRLQVHHGRRP